MLDKAITIVRAVVYHMGAAIDGSYRHKVDKTKAEVGLVAGDTLYKECSKAGPQFVYLTSRKGDQPADGGDPMHGKVAVETVVHAHDLTKFIQLFRGLNKEVDSLTDGEYGPLFVKLDELLVEGAPFLTCPLQGHTREADVYFNPLETTTDQPKLQDQNGTVPARPALTESSLDSPRESNPPTIDV